MTAKTIFEQVYRADQEVAALQERAKSLRELAYSVSPGPSDGQPSSHGGQNSRVERAAIALTDVADRLVNFAEDLAENQRNAWEVLEKIKKPRFRQILEMRYFSGLSWAEIAEKMGYSSPAAASHAHGWALQEADKILSGL